MGEQFCFLVCFLVCSWSFFVSGLDLGRILGLNAIDNALAATLSSSPGTLQSNISAQAGHVPPRRMTGPPTLAPSSLPVRMIFMWPFVLPVSPCDDLLFVYNAHSQAPRVPILVAMTY